MDPTLKKCPEISQSMLDKGGSGQNRNAENERLRKLLDFGDFQQINSEGFSSVLDAKGAVYRRINVYSKSIEQYWKERNRRKQTWRLSSEGLTYKQIAEKLGVSEKTIQRDIKKLRPYYIGQINKAYQIMQEEQIRKFESHLNGLSLTQRFRVLTDLVCEHIAREKEREYNRHLIKIIVDMDHLVHGVFPTLKFWPDQANFSMTKPIHFRIVLRVEGKEIKYGELRMG